MWITRFTETNNTVHDYTHLDAVEAKIHLLIFQDDDAGVYKNIAVLQDNTVLYIMLPVNGKLSRVIGNGDTVRLKPEYASEKERELLYRVSNINEHTERAEITCITTDMIIKPTETVGLEMIEVVNAA